MDRFGGIKWKWRDERVDDPSHRRSPVGKLEQSPRHQRKRMDAEGERELFRRWILGMIEGGKGELVLPLSKSKGFGKREGGMMIHPGVWGDGSAAGG